MAAAIKRLFFGFQVEAPWPIPLPKGRIIPEQSRHMTLAFLGNYDFELLDFSKLPMPSFRVGKTGFFDDCLFLPERHPRVVAWHGNFFAEQSYCETFAKFFDAKTPWLCHTTIAREPFDKEEWLRAFHQLPFCIKNLHLYESFPGLQYVPLWSIPFIAPFEEFEHTADIAFRVRGDQMQEIFYNAFTALCWRFPQLLPFKPTSNINHLDDVIISLNECIAQADAMVGCPFKAISFHGELKQKQDFLEWEMIVDV